MPSAPSRLPSPSGCSSSSAARSQLETYLWERSLLRATDTFQAQILDIQQADLALFILWARVGTPLPLDQFSRPDGSGYASGTEYEFERALRRASRSADRRRSSAT